MSTLTLTIKTRLGAQLRFTHPNIISAQKEAQLYSDACEWEITQNGETLINHINYGCIPKQEKAH